MRKNTKKLLWLMVSIIVIAIIGGVYWYLLQRNESATVSDSDISESATQESIDALSKAHGSGNILAVIDNKIVNIDLTKSEKTENDSNAKSYSTATSDDGSIIVLDQDDNLRILNIDGKEKDITTASEYNPLPVISPDGKQMLVVSFSNAERDFGYKLQIFTTGNEYVRDIASSQSKISSPLWGNSSTVYFASISESGSTIYKADTSGSGEEKILDVDDLYIIDMACADDDVYFTASSGKNDSQNTNIYNIIDGKENAITTESGTYGDLQISPDGAWIGYIDNDSVLNIRNCETGASYEVQQVGHLLGWF